MWCDFSHSLGGGLPCGRIHSPLRLAPRHGEAQVPVCSCVAWPGTLLTLVLGSSSGRPGQQQRAVRPTPALAWSLSFHMRPGKGAQVQQVPPPLQNLPWSPTACRVEESRHFCPTFSICPSLVLFSQLHLGPQPSLCSINPRPLITVAKPLNSPAPHLSLGCSHLPKHYLLSNLLFFPS